MSRRHGNGPISCGFVMEQALGHVTHHRNLERWTAERDDIVPYWMPVPMHHEDVWERVPVVRGNWSLKASLRARRAIGELRRGRKLDAMLFHTQTTSLFSLGTMRKVPSVISLDATPKNYDSVAAAYGHRPDRDGWLAGRKSDWYRAAFRAAAHLVTWCRWAKMSLVCDYGVDENRVTVIPPGVDMSAWSSGSPAPPSSERPRLLFVGADFERKGGAVLAAAYRKGLSEICEIDVVTRDAAGPEAFAGLPEARVHTGLGPNSPALMELFQKADIFVFPTLGDCLPIAVMEAMAVGLPVITTKVGALNEEVEDGHNGFVVPANDVGAIIDAVRSLCADRRALAAMAEASRTLAMERFDARKNYNALLDVVKRAADGEVT